MSSAYATVEDVITLFRPLTPEEVTRATALLPLLSDELRLYAHRVGRDLDQMVAEIPGEASAAKEVLVSEVSRVLRQSTTGEPMTQESQSGLGYSWSGTYAVPGGGIGNAILPSDLKRLGLKRQRYGVLEPYDNWSNRYTMD